MATSAGVPAERAVQAGAHQHLVGHVERHVGEQHGEQGDDHAAVAQLGPGLDHLRQPEHRALGGVEGHEQRAERDAEHAGQDRPAQREAQGRADEADRDGEVLEVAEEPQHGLLPGLAVPFRIGDPVDRVHLDLAEQAAPSVVSIAVPVARLCRHVASRGQRSHGNDHHRFPGCQPLFHDSSGCHRSEGDSAGGGGAGAAAGQATAVTSQRRSGRSCARRGWRPARAWPRWPSRAG